MNDIHHILPRVRSKDMAAFGELVKTYQPYAFRLAVRILCSESDAEDVAQEAFVRVWRNIDRYDPSVLFTTWLYRIVTNLCLDQLRLRKRRGAFRSGVQSEAGGESDPPCDLDLEHALSTADLVRIIRAIAQDLPDTQRLVFTMRDLQDLSIEEVRQITGLSRASIKTNLHYARRSLRARMNAIDGERSQR